MSNSLKIPVMENIESLTEDELEFYLENWMASKEKHYAAYVNANKNFQMVYNEKLRRNSKQYGDSK